MRKLHPDKAGGVPGIDKAAEVARQARDVCERELSKEEPPNFVLDLHSAPLNVSPGHRRFQLKWTAPRDHMHRPVRRYVVAAMDPAYGRALTIAVLEPDYSEELRRFVSVEDLNSFVLAEEELQKMPALWQQANVTVQVAAANDTGQSPWATVQVSLATGMAVRPQLGMGARGIQQSPGSPSADDAEFNKDLQSRRGAQLRSWLEQQKKAPLAAWLRTMYWPAAGTKEDLVTRIIYVVEGR
jgi:hypothetical protein